MLNYQLNNASISGTNSKRIVFLSFGKYDYNGSSISKKKCPKSLVSWIPPKTLQLANSLPQYQTTNTTFVFVLN